MNPMLFATLNAVLAAIPFEKVFAAIMTVFIRNPEDGKPNKDRAKALAKVAKCAKVASDLLNPDETPELDPLRAKTLEAWKEGNSTPTEAKEKLGV